MGQPTERDNDAPEPNTSPADGAPEATAPEPDAPEHEAPYVPPVKAYERPAVTYRPPTETVSTSEPTQALPVVIGSVALPAQPAAAAGAKPVEVPPLTAATTWTVSAPQPAETTTVLGAVPASGPAASGPESSGPGPSGPGSNRPSGILGGLVGDGQPSRAPRALLGAGIVLVVLAGLYTGAQWLVSDKVASGTHVAGVDIGGLSSQEAKDQLDAGLSARAKEPVQVTAGDAHTTLDPTTAGLKLDAAATVAQLTGFSMSPAHLWNHLFGGSDVAPVVSVDDAHLKTAVDGLVESLATPPVDGTVTFTDGQPVATAAKDGAKVTASDATHALTTRWLVTTGSIDLPTEAVAPQITQSETDAALTQAKKIVSAPVTVTVGDQKPELPADALASAASFQPVDGNLKLTVDGAQLVDAVVARTNNLLTNPQDAHFEFQGGTPVVVGGESGTSLDPDALAAAVQKAATGDNRTAAVKLTQRDPQDSKAALQGMGVKEVVSAFDTPLTPEPVRTANLARAAQLLTGHLVKPGETFSLTQAIGPITTANGYQSAGVISNGVHTEGIGGGLSQMATTTYNAGFFAGFENVEHRPHSVWFTRYPAGREATMAVGSLDMRFKNNSPYGAVMQAYIQGGRLHVQIWSTKYFTVQTSASPKTNVVPTTTVHRSGANCAAYVGGQDGFTITNYRQVFHGTDKVIDEHFTWTYKPDNPVVCDAGGAPPAGPDSGAGDN
ncbi:MAG: VanW family protein [Promicromonosporaceae bacterium]|nr:VanW family protein [Promicromonosporaceae bacterium]